MTGLSEIWGSLWSPANSASNTGVTSRLRVEQGTALLIMCYHTRYVVPVPDSGPINEWQRLYAGSPTPSTTEYLQFPEHQNSRSRFVFAGASIFGRKFTAWVMIAAYDDSEGINIRWSLPQPNPCQSLSLGKRIFSRLRDDRTTKAPGLVRDSP